MVHGSLVAIFVSTLFAGAGCTLHHSKTVLPDRSRDPVSPNAKFITEDDAGLALLSLIVVSEPDHYAVLYERARRRCPKLTHVQIDFYTDIWILVSFPIVRLTAICDRSPARPVVKPTPQPKPTPPIKPVPRIKPTPKPTPKLVPTTQPTSKTPG